MMKADGGALIYIVLAVISLVVTAIGKSKKKEFPPVSSSPSPVEPQAPPQAPQTTWQKELEDIFGKVLVEPEVVVDKPNHGEPKPFMKETREIVPEAVPSKVEEWNKYAGSKKLDVPVATNSGHLETIILEDEVHELSVVNLEEFELNKAVIYAEILNRKYF